MVWLSDGEIMLKICLFVSTEYMNVTDTARRGGAADFKVGVQNRIRKRSERHFFLVVPPLFQMWGYKQANISKGLLNVLKFAVWLSR